MRMASAISARLQCVALGGLSCTVFAIKRGSIRLVEAVGGDEDAIQQAFEAARRAIIRCEGDGYPDDLEAGEQTLSFSFNP